MKTPMGLLGHKVVPGFSIWAVSSLLSAAPAHAQDLASCAALDDHAQRLVRDDRLAGRGAAPTTPAMPPAAAVEPRPAVNVGDHPLAALLRRGFCTGREATPHDWGFPSSGALRGSVAFDRAHRL
jgi:hypothetical protein